MNDDELAQYVAAKVLLAKPADREHVMQTEIPLDRFARVLPLIPIAMARVFDGFTTDRRLRLGMEGILRTFVRQAKQ
ncbi:hypothetical protein GCM10009588_31040 [Microbacterium phyllosphaerae]|nr:hypothetical protein [Microbacterium phyllosphaerae]